MIVRKIFRKLGEKTADRRFGSILAVNDELSAMNYYVEMIRQIRKTGRDLRIAAVYDSTPKTRKAVVDRRRRDFWEWVAEDYNAQFGTSFSAIGDRFQEYILDVSRRLALGQIDLVLVVNPYLTNFTTANLNTLSLLTRDLWRMSATFIRALSPSECPKLSLMYFSPSMSITQIIT